MMQNVEYLEDSKPTSFNRSSRRAQNKEKRRCEYLVATHLTRLDGVDPNRVLKIKNIASLGSDSAPTLREYLSQFGTVEEVLLCRSQNEIPQQIDGYRHRPSRFCFVVMGSPEEAAAVLGNGNDNGNDQQKQGDKDTKQNIYAEEVVLRACPALISSCLLQRPCSWAV